MTALRYELVKQDTASGARLGRVHTPHGTFDTPAFMPVGTQATIKGQFPRTLRDIGAQVILANTYHLLLRPGSDLVAQMGGLHGWMGWHGPILTDSGGFQVFSLADINRINDDGVQFKSHLDGKIIDLTPERSMQVQNELGSDMIMAFDDCPPGVAAPEATQQPDCDKPSQAVAGPRRHAIDAAAYADRVKLANERTLRWLERCKAAHGRPDEQALFGIVQGGTDLDQRSWCVQRVCSIDLPGYAIGGVAVGEGPQLIQKVVEHTAPLLPEDRPRYLMGVGYERDIVMAVRAGVDMFDCVLPTRNGRNGNAFTRFGQIRVRNARYRDDPLPLDPQCDCPVCGGGAGVWSDQGENRGGPAGVGMGLGADMGAGLGAAPGVGPGAGFSRSYLRHLFLADEMLGPILVSLHNLRHFQRLLLDIRAAINQNGWSWFFQRWPVAVDAAAAEEV